MVGVVQSEIDISDTFDPAVGAVREAWLVVQDLRRSYAVRSVDARAPIADDIDVLVVPMPSGLSADAIFHLHEAMYRGTPTLLLCDGAPFSLWQQGFWLFLLISADLMLLSGGGFR